MTTTAKRSPILPANPSFAGHQTFAFRSAWLKKGLDALQDPQVGGSRVFGQEDALVTLGVGKNMVQSIRHWTLSTRVAEEVPGTRGRELRPTPLGIALFGSPTRPGWDPYLEDEGTLWLLHWQLAGPGSQAFTWAWAFNCLPDFEFSKTPLGDSVYEAACGNVPKDPTRGTIDRDIDCFLHTYVARDTDDRSEDSIDCPLRALRLIVPAFEGQYRYRMGRKGNLSPHIFAFALAVYWNWRDHGGHTLQVREIVYGEGSPGLVFKLDYDTVLDYLDQIEYLTRGALQFDDTVLVRQVVRHPARPLDPMSLLEKHYA